MMRNSIMQAFMDMANAEKKEERRQRAEAKRSSHYRSSSLRASIMICVTPQGW
jgi:hypothetical protein